ncbi:DUF2865 domain-containing protein [Brucella intermedia]|uniref:DUF2865 domain-containing protein n=1 Tax=Brucella TaxID=234 RepID=UPI001AEC81ED|nr:DUF2865 domain-containing protein [Brucella intermedia]
MMKLTAIFYIMLIVLVSPVAIASTCGASSSATDVSSSILRRQLSALEAIRRARRCVDEPSGGLFNACRDVAMQIQQVRRLMSLKSKWSADCESADEKDKVRAQRRAHARSPKVRSETPVVSTTGVRRETQNRQRSNNTSGQALSYCVRLSDGYFFPTPNSQFRQKGGLHAALTQCQMICETPDMAVYVLHDRFDETGEMISVADGRPYSELSTAYFYQEDDREFKRCSWNRYIARINSAFITRDVTSQLEKVETPVPESKPQDHNHSRAVRPQGLAELRIPDRPVRMVGPTFIPDGPARKAVTR